VQLVDLVDVRGDEAVHLGLVVVEDAVHALLQQPQIQEANESGPCSWQSTRSECQAFRTVDLCDS
jgi:hypothetical protein